MCAPTTRCLDRVIVDSPIGRLPRRQQAARLDLSRGQMLDALAGRPGPRATRALAELTRISRAEVLMAASVTRCPVRRPRRDRNPYGERVAALATLQGITLDRVQRTSGVDRTSFYHAFGDGCGPGEAHVLAVATVLGADVIELARLAGHSVDHPLDLERLREGLSREAYARSRSVDARMLFGSRRPSSPALAHRVALASGATEEQATEVAAEARQAARGPAGCEIGLLVCSYLDRNGLAVADLAKQLGVARQAVSSWIDGVTSPNTDSLTELAEAIRMPYEKMRSARQADQAAVAARAGGVGAQLRSLRRSLGLSRPAAAGLLNISVLQLRRGESGRLDEAETSRLVARARPRYEMATVPVRSSR